MRWRNDYVWDLILLRKVTSFACFKAVLLFFSPAGDNVEGHENHQSGESVTQPRLEVGVSRILMYNVTATPSCQEK
jgi:hypothetical protein